MNLRVLVAFFINLAFRSGLKVGNENLFGHLSELDLLYGKSFGKILQLSISGGGGVIGGEKMVDHGDDPLGTNQNFKRIYFTTLNFPIEAGLYLNPVKYFGIGIKRFASLNTKQSLNGFLIAFKFGKVR